MEALIKTKQTNLRGNMQFPIYIVRILNGKEVLVGQSVNDFQIEFIFMDCPTRKGAKAEVARRTPFTVIDPISKARIQTTINSLVFLKDGNIHPCVNSVRDLYTANWRHQSTSGTGAEPWVHCNRFFTKVAHPLSVRVVREREGHIQLENMTISTNRIQSFVMNYRHRSISIVPSDLFNDGEVIANAEMTLRDGQKINILSSMEEFYTLGWRPLSWWYGTRLGIRIPGVQSDYQFTREQRAQEKKRLLLAERYIANQQ